MKLEVFSPRWGHNDTYDVERTNTGWKITFGAKGGTCDKRGNPHLFRILRDDGIHYPAALETIMEQLWEEAVERKLSDVEVQEYLNLIGNWLQEITKTIPETLKGLL